MIKAFTVAETVVSANAWTIRSTFELFDYVKSAGGSAAVFESRLFGLSPSNYLRMVRDVYGAKLYGKTGYIVFYFTDKKKALALEKELNKRFSIIFEGK